MVDAIEQRKAHDAFPRTLAALVGLVRVLPPAVADALLARIGTRLR